MNKLHLCIIAAGLGIISPAFADDTSGYNTSSTDTVTIGSNPYDGSATAGDAQQMQAIQQGTQDLKSQWSGDAQRQAVEQGSH